jgi:hypothetical protein
MTYLVDLQHIIVTISVLVNMSSRKSILFSFARCFHVHMNGQIKCQTSLVGYGTDTLDWRPSLVIREENAFDCTYEKTVYLRNI